LKIRIQIDDLASSNITDIVYISISNNKDMTDFYKVNGDLIVTFSNGTRYAYNDLPLGILSKCFDSESFGSAFSKLIKPNYIGNRVVKPWENE
jgi:hypothetical protein